jgi:hypothetical protein
VASSKIGDYRVFVFLVCAQLRMGDSDIRSLAGNALYEKGLMQATSVADIGLDPNEPLGKRRCFVLVYHYYKQRFGDCLPVPLGLDRSCSAKKHLETAGLWAKLTEKTR